MAFRIRAVVTLRLCTRKNLQSGSLANLLIFELRQIGRVRVLTDRDDAKLFLAAPRDSHRQEFKSSCWIG